MEVYLWLPNPQTSRTLLNPSGMYKLEKEMATYSSVLAWRIPGTVEPGGLPSMGLHRVGHDWSNFAAAAAGCIMMSLHLYLKFCSCLVSISKNNSSCLWCHFSLLLSSCFFILLLQHCCSAGFQTRFSWDVIHVSSMILSPSLIKQEPHLYR